MSEHSADYDARCKELTCPQHGEANRASAERHLSRTATHDTYRHREDGRICILLEDGTWFVPLDVGGEGFGCERAHGDTGVLPPVECDNYLPPLTCLTAPSSESGRCDKCAASVTPPGSSDA